MMTSQTVGTMTPAIAAFMCSRSSWRFRRYQGALDGFGVTSALAWSSSGALTRNESRKRREREHHGGDELDEDEVRPDEDFLVAMLGPGGWRPVGRLRLWPLRSYPALSR